MSERRNPSFVIIAPKGSKFSSISEEDFTAFKNPDRGKIIDLTLEQYGKWVIEADSLKASYKNSDINTTITLKRYKLNNTVENTGEIQDFSGMAPGHFYATMPSTSYFRATEADINSSSGGARLYRNFLASDAFLIRPFYHKDKFYLFWGGGASAVNKQVTMTPTTLKAVYTYGSVTQTIEYSLNA